MLLQLALIFIYSFPAITSHIEDNENKDPGEIIIDDTYEVSPGTPTFLTPIGKMFMPLEGLVDIEAEKTRINKEIDKTDKDLKQIQGKLSNPNFTERAPAEIVQENLDRKDSLRKKLEQLQEMLQNLS